MSEDNAIRALRWFMQLVAGLMVFGVIMMMIHHKPTLSPAAPVVTHHDEANAATS